MEWKNLPTELIYTILAKYDGRFSVRKGKLMTKLAKNETRTRLLESISPKYHYKTELMDIIYVCLPINRHKQCFISVSDDEMRVCFPKVWNDRGEEGES